MYLENDILMLSNDNHSLYIDVFILYINVIQ